MLICSFMKPSIFLPHIIVPITHSHRLLVSQLSYFFNFFKPLTCFLPLITPAAHGQYQNARVPRVSDLETDQLSKRCLHGVVKKWHRTWKGRVVSNFLWVRHGFCVAWVTTLWLKQVLHISEELCNSSNHVFLTDQGFIERAAKTRALELGT